jgi:hypothetical protein
VDPSTNSAPAVEQLRELKEQLSTEAWLYLLGAEEVGLQVDESSMQRELLAHLARVLVLLCEDL